jgi:hypothetical protein
MTTKQPTDTCLSYIHQLNKPFSLGRLLNASNADLPQQFRMPPTVIFMEHMRASTCIVVHSRILNLGGG